MEKPNRTRRVQLNVRMTAEELALIHEKMALLKTRNVSAYARKMLIDGYIIVRDYADIKAHTAELQKIGVNVNQIARRLNTMGGAYAKDAKEIKAALKEVWRLERRLLSENK